MGKYRTREQVSTAIDKELLAKFRELAKETRIPASRLWDEAMEDLWVKYNKLNKSDKKTP